MQSGVQGMWSGTERVPVALVLAHQPVVLTHFPPSSFTSRLSGLFQANAVDSSVVAAVFAAMLLEAIFEYLITAQQYFKRAPGADLYT